MPAKMLRDAPTLVVGKTYLTEADVRADDGSETVDILTPRASTVTPPTITATDVGFTSARVLSRYTDTPEIGVGLGVGQRVIVDNVRCREWTGRHAFSEATQKPTIVSNGISLISAALAVGNFAAAVPDIQTAQSWSAFFVLRRTVGSFGGVAPVMFFGCNVLSTYQLTPLYFNQAGDVSASGVVSGGAASGRTAAGLLPNATLKVIGVSGRIGSGWQIFDETGVRQDATNVGNGNGVSFSLFPDYATLSPVAYLGATRSGGVTSVSSGNAILYRSLFFPRLDPWTNAHKFLRVLSKLKSEYGVA